MQQQSHKALKLLQQDYANLDKVHAMNHSNEIIEGEFNLATAKKSAASTEGQERAADGMEYVQGVMELIESSKLSNLEKRHEKIKFNQYA